MEEGGHSRTRLGFLFRRSAGCQSVGQGRPGACQFCEPPSAMEGSIAFATRQKLLGHKQKARFAPAALQSVSPLSKKKSDQRLIAMRAPDQSRHCSSSPQKKGAGHHSHPPAHRSLIPCRLNFVSPSYKSNPPGLYCLPNATKQKVCGLSEPIREHSDVVPCVSPMLYEPGLCWLRASMSNALLKDRSGDVEAVI